MTMRKLFCIALALASFSKTPARSQVSQDNWKELNLSSTTIAEASILYEKSLESKLPLFERKYKKLRTDIGNLNRIIDQKERIISELNRILGITDPPAEWQDKLMTGMASLYSAEQMTFYIVKKTTLKDFLRSGGQLPDFSYDKNDDTVVYKPTYHFGSKEGPITNFELAVPIGSEESFEKDFDAVFQALDKMFGVGYLGTIFHEIVEMSLITRVRPADQHIRWFSDGFANAVACELLDKYAGPECSSEYLKLYDVNDYRDLEKEINLRYWMMANWCIETGLECESDLESARYSYATYEARRLIAEHGLDCVKRILDALPDEKRRTTDDLLAAIEDQTGVDMETRLENYQTFQLPREGGEKYAGLLKSAVPKDDYECMITSTLRLLELQDNPFSRDSLQMRASAALWLFKMGRQEAADKAMLTFMEQLEDGAPKQVYDYFAAGFVGYALQCNQPLKARSAAEHILKDHPDHIPSVTVRMLSLVEDGKTAEARELAQSLVERAKEGTLPYEAAREVLGKDLNRPEQRQ